jgi:RNA polymerase sigma-70 factor (ECF subfamily)
MASQKELSDFLKSSEKRAFKQVVYAVRDEDAALDIVQDSMIKLSQSYGDKNIEELPLLFTRIVQNCTKDWFRRQKVRNTWVTLFSKFGKNDEGEDIDPQDFFENPDSSSYGKESSLQLERMELSTILEKEIEKLPKRQREAFLMRYWEELDISETAQAMGCSEGSVKTHCSRASQTLAAALRKLGISF